MRRVRAGSIASKSEISSKAVSGKSTPSTRMNRTETIYSYSGVNENKTGQEDPLFDREP